MYHISLSARHVDHSAMHGDGSDGQITEVSIRVGNEVTYMHLDESKVTIDDVKNIANDVGVTYYKTRREGFGDPNFRFMACDMEVNELFFMVFGLCVNRRVRSGYKPSTRR